MSLFRPNVQCCFSKTHPRYLDMECLAILGITLAQRLVSGIKGPSEQHLVG